MEGFVQMMPVMTNWRKLLPAAGVGLILVALLLGRGLHAAPAGTIHYPDLQTIIPLDSFSVGQPSATTRELRYTHHSANLGDGPLEVRPQYDPATDTARAFQRLYTHDAAGNWSLAAEVPVVGTFVYHPAHGHYHFPFAQFGLYQVAVDGTVGAAIATSPKLGFCLGDSALENASIVHAGVFGYAGANCVDPTHVEGISVGWSDVYDSTDLGQSIDITTLPNGTYWFRAVADPNNYLTEKDKTNNITDVKLQITGTAVVVVGSVVQPNSQPPTVVMMAPAAGAVSGATVQASASASDPSGIVSLQFLLDGSPIGAPFTSAPYSLVWDSTTTPDGAHYLSAQAKAGTTFLGTATPVVITVSNNTAPPPPPPPGTFGVDKVVPVDGAGTISTASFSTAGPNELLLAFVGSDGPTSGGQSVAVSGANATWTLVKRANTQLGTAEIWQAFAGAALSNAVVTSTQSLAGYHQSLTAVAFIGALGTGANAAAGAATGGPSVSLSTTHDGSVVYGIGNDWDQAVARTPGSNQMLVHQWVDTATGDTFWVQARSSAVPTHGTAVTLNDTAPTTDRWNFAAAEIVPAALPAVTISNVLATSRTSSSATITWTTNVPATSAVDYGLNTNYGTSVADLALLTSHATPLTGLTPFTTYHYRITSDAGGGNTATAGDFIFTTPAVSQIVCSITAPTAGQTVSGTIGVSAHATSTADVSGIQFQLDGVNLGAEVLNLVTDATISWDTTRASNGGHALTCIARDPTGNTATSPQVSVTVSNTILVAVPNVVGLAQGAATTSITGANLTVGTTTSALSATVPAGSVISQNPRAGTQVAPGTAVALVISTGPPLASATVDVTVFSDGKGTRTSPSFSTSTTGDVLVALAGSDGPASGNQTLTVSGAGLQWTLVRRANGQHGTSEIWTAKAVNQLTNVTVKSTQSASGYQQSLTVVAFKGAAGIGASAVAGAINGAPTVSLTTTKDRSLVYGVANDWDNALARVPGTGQVMVHQWVDTSTGDTYWAQAASAAIALSGTSVQLNDTSPTTDRWNFAGVEILSK